MSSFDRVRKTIAASLLVALAACSGGAVGSRQSTGTVPASAATPSPSLPTTTQSVSFTFTQTVEPASVTRRPQYVGAGTKSVSIVVDSVNGIAVPAASYTTHSNVTLANCPCTVSAGVPPGNDVFTITTYDGQYVGGAQQGNVISDATTPSTTIAVGETTAVMLTLNGHPAKFAFGALPANPQAGTAIPATAFTVVVEDVDGNTIIGTYATPVTLSTSDTTGAITLATSGSDAPTSGTLLSSGDTATIAYSGLAVRSTLIIARAVGAQGNTTAFAPAAQPIVVTGAPLVMNVPTIKLNQVTKSGSFTATEAGWTNPPYNKSLAIAPGTGCGSVGSIAQAPGSTTAFTTTEAASPAVGSCTVTLEDAVGGSASSIALAYDVHGTIVYGYTGGSQTYPVPSGVTSISVAMSGAAGGGANIAAGGDGGSLTATLPVTPSAMLSVLVGGEGGHSNTASDGSAGFNGGGSGGAPGGGISGAGGGGASSLLDAGTLLAIAGGGGGSVGAGGQYTGQGGAGGHSAVSGQTVGGLGGGGATLSAGGSGGAAAGFGPGATNGANGVTLVGGNGGSGAQFLEAGEGGGGGGGGYYGGGGGGGGSGTDAGAGGGGTSDVLAPGATGVTYTDGNNAGTGSITITW